MITKTSEESLRFLEGITGEKLTLGSFILAIRQGEELSQVKFAEILGMSRQMLCDIEHNRKNISPKKAAEYADILGYSSKQFIRLCLQDMLNRDGFKFSVDIADAA